MRNISIMVIVMLFLITGCGNELSESLLAPTGDESVLSKDNLTIADIAYSKKTADNCVVYIKEDGEYTPYYVLTKTYNDTDYALLLRKYLLNDVKIFNTIDSPAARYDGSVLDMFLENDFIQVFDDSFRDKIQLVDLSTIKYEHLGKSNPDTMSIKRKVFLLSYTELGLSKSTLEAVEGKKLSFFEDSNSRIAFKENGVASSWWTRTAHNWGGDLAVGVASDGAVGHGSTSSENGVRPAFCLFSDTNIKEGTINGQIRYILE